MFKNISLIWPCNMSRAILYDTFADHLARENWNPSWWAGLDLASYGGKNIPLYAAQLGKVTKVKFKVDGLGKYVIIDHPGGVFRTVYGHMDRIDVVDGQNVKQGEMIGTMGTTGNSTGVHVHFTLLKDGNDVDPMPYLYSTGPIEIEPITPVISDEMRDADLPPASDFILSIVAVPVVEVIAPDGVRLRTSPNTESISNWAGVFVPYGTRLSIIELITDSNNNIWGRLGWDQYMAMTWNGRSYVKALGD